MTYFNLEAATFFLKEGGSPVDALGLAFGVPECLLNIGKSAALAFLPSGLILSISQNVSEGRAEASKRIAEWKYKLLMDNGLFEIDTENGTFIFKSDSSKALLEENKLQKINDLAGFTKALGAAIQTGAELYENIKDVKTALQNQIDCYKSYTNFLKANDDVAYKTLFDDGFKLDATLVYASELAIIQESIDFINSADQALANARKIMQDRFNDPSLEPIFSNGLLPDGTTFLVASAIDGGDEETANEVFRLVFGPPKSKKGQFLLSIDGLYYDSQTGGLPEVSGIIPPDQAYKFDYAANLGGKGTAISLKQLDTYVDTIFSLEAIDESPLLQNHYTKDTFLQILEGQKNKHISDLNQQVSSLIVSGYTHESAVVIGIKNQMLSIIALHTDKINRRKKQIEVAIKAPALFGEGELFKPGQVPINDFSFLKGFNLSIAFDKQQKLVFKQGEVKDVVLPLKPKFVKAQDSVGSVYLPHLVVPKVGQGGIIFDLSSNNVSSPASILSLNDQIVTDDLFAIYNFLESEVVDALSEKFKVLNSISISGYNNAQLVATHASSVFISGLAIPYLSGITHNFIKLPDTKEFQDLTYNPKGFTIDTWVHVPNIATSWATSSYHKILLGCENFGGTASAVDANKVVFSKSSDTVRGLLMGFTRDRQIVSGLDPVTSETTNPVSAVAFYLAPTQSINTSDITFINSSPINCTSATEVLKLVVPIRSVVNGATIGAVSSTFIHLAVVAEPKTDTIKIYCDGVLMTTSSISHVFGVEATKVPAIPSFFGVSSYEHPTGPLLNEFFTPWIVGGGYSENSTQGFMGQDSGKYSGLGGFIGSLKFYNRSLSNLEVLTNYRSQQAFFKNIRT